MYLWVPTGRVREAPYSESFSSRIPRRAEIKLYRGESTQSPGVYLEEESKKRKENLIRMIKK